MKNTININTILNRYYDYIYDATIERINSWTYSSIISKRKYEKAAKIIDLDINQEDKDKAISIITDTIEQMKNSNKPLIIDNLIFAIAYPESYDLIIPYYDILEIKIIEDKNITSHIKTDEIKNKIESAKKATITIYSQLISSKDINDLEKTLQLSLTDIKKTLDTYKNIKALTKKEFDDKDLAKKIYDDIVNEVTIKEICKKYNITNDRINFILKEELEDKKYQEILDRLSFNKAKKQKAIKNTLSKLLQLIPNGIEYNNEIIKFTMLDYYSISNINPKTILKELNQLKPKTRTEAVNITITKKFLNININQGPNVNKDYYLKTKYKITINGKNYYMLDYYDQIMDIFKINNIPTYEKLFELSLLRLSKNQPILPLIKEKK